MAWQRGEPKIFLGAKGRNDNMQWKLDLGVIRAIICFAKAIGHLNRNIDEG